MSYWHQKVGCLPMMRGMLPLPSSALPMQQPGGQGGRLCWAMPRRVAACQPDLDLPDRDRPQNLSCMQYPCQKKKNLLTYAPSFSVHTNAIVYIDSGWCLPMRGCYWWSKYRGSEGGEALACLAKSPYLEARTALYPIRNKRGATKWLVRRAKLRG